MQEVKEVTFNKFEDAFKFVNDKLEAVREQATGYAKSFQEMTGYHPETPMKAADVVNIFARLKAGN